MIGWKYDDRWIILPVSLYRQGGMQGFTFYGMGVTVGVSVEVGVAVTVKVGVGVAVSVAVGVGVNVAVDGMVV